MSFIENYELLTIVIIILIFVSVAAPILYWAFKSYEIVIAIMLLSPAVSWVFAKNIPVEVGEIEPNTSSYIRVGLVMMMGLVGYIKFFQLSKYSQFKAPFYLKLFSIFLFIAFISTTYSVDQFYTFTRASQFIAFFGFLLGLFYWTKDEFHLDKAINIYFWVIVFGILINILSLVLFPGRAWWWTAPHRFQGVTGHPNELGAYCMLSYPILMWKYEKVFSKGKFFIILLFSSVLLIHIMSGSRSSFAAAVFGLFVWYFVSKNVVKFSTIFVLIILFASCLFLYDVKISSLERGHGSEITDLTGREEFWQASILLFSEKPIIGYGYGVSGSVLSDPRFHSGDLVLWSGSARTSLHNGYLSLLIGLGALGFVILMTALITPLWRVFFSEVSVYKSLILVIVLQILLINFFESALAGSSSFTPSVLWFFWIIAARTPSIINSSHLKNIS